MPLVKHLKAFIYLSIFQVSCYAQVAYDPLSIPGWVPPALSRDHMLSPYDIILDVADTTGLPRNFRSPTFLVPPRTNTTNIQGFNSLRISGSAQFSASQILHLLRYLEKTHKLSRKNIIIVDLREEPHGFINNDAVTWYFGPLSTFQNLSSEEVLKAERHRIRLVRPQENVTIFTITKSDDGIPVNKIPQLAQVQHVKSEEELIQKLGARYIRLPVTDHFRPENKDVDQFIQLFHTLTPQDWVHFKCRGGKGRTTVFMALYDMLKNPELSKEDIIARQKLIDGIDLSFLPLEIKSKHWKIRLSADRIKFLSHFYDYLHDPQGYPHVSWSQWATKLPLSTTDHTKPTCAYE